MSLRTDRSVVPASSDAPPARTPVEKALWRAANDAVHWPGQIDALDAFARSGLPHRRLEAWRWTDLRSVMRTLTPIAQRTDETSRPTHERYSGSASIFAPVDPFEVRFTYGEGGWAVEPPEGIAITHARNTVIHPLLADHPMATLATAMVDRALSIKVRRGTHVARPLMLSFAASDAQQHARVLLDMEAGAQLMLLEEFNSTGQAFSNVTLEGRLGAGAQLHRVAVQSSGTDKVEICAAALTLESDAQFVQTQLVFGGRATRLETRLDIVGDGAVVELRSAAALSGAAHADITTHVRFSARGGVARQLHRAALRDQAKGIFQGKFHVGREGQETDARMSAGALLLSDGAEANARPELEIYADNVQCLHGSTSGALDDDAVFYLCQRGLSAEAARALLVEAHLCEVFEGIAHQGVKSAMLGALARWLGRTS